MPYAHPLLVIASEWVCFSPVLEVAAWYMILTPPASRRVTAFTGNRDDLAEPSALCNQYVIRTQSLQARSWYTPRYSHGASSPAPEANVQAALPAANTALNLSTRRRSRCLHKVEPLCLLRRVCLLFSQKQQCESACGALRKRRRAKRTRGYRTYLGKGVQLSNLGLEQLVHCAVCRVRCQLGSDGRLRELGA